MNGGANEFSHQVRQHAAMQSNGDFAPFAFGHIATYDPTTSSARFYIPSMRDENDNPALTDWMPLSTTFAGASWGMQFGPIGGSTPENPTKGELCVIGFCGTQGGLRAGLCSIYNTINKPPFPNILGGEIGIKSNSGAVIYFNAAGQIEIESPSAIQITAPTTNTSGNMVPGTGCSGSFTTPTGQTVTVQDGVIINIF